MVPVPQAQGFKTAFTLACPSPDVTQYILVDALCVLGLHSGNHASIFYEPVRMAEWAKPTLSRAYIMYPDKHRLWLVNLIKNALSSHGSKTFMFRPTRSMLL